jgi:hypothetical protein
MDTLPALEPEPAFESPKRRKRRLRRARADPVRAA